MYNVELSYEDLNTIEDALQIAFEQENEFRSVGEDYIYLAMRVRKLIDAINSGEVRLQEDDL